LNGRQRFSGFSHPRQRGEEGMRTLVTGGTQWRRHSPIASSRSRARHHRCAPAEQDSQEIRLASAAGADVVVDRAEKGDDGGLVGRD